jgi:hypothetical protein
MGGKSHTTNFTHAIIKNVSKQRPGLVTAYKWWSGLISSASLT